MECFSTIVGTSFRDSDAKRAVNAMQPGESDFRLEREPDNQYDPLAIKVLFGEDEIFVGYLAKANNATIASALDDGEEPRVEVIDFDGRKPVVKVSWKRRMNKPILCLDFDGVIHSYTSGWKGADVIPDLPVPGAVEFIQRAVQEFTVAIYSSRSGQPMGIEAMQFWLKTQFYRLMDAPDADAVLGLIQWPIEKPPALVTIDDRALTFSGNWADYPLDELAAFRPWNKK